MSDSTTIVIFGASGDLTRRKLVPALFKLYLKGRLWEPFRIVGISRRDIPNDEYRRQLESGIQEFAAQQYDQPAWEVFSSRITYIAGDLGQVEDMIALDSQLRADEVSRANRVYYLAIAPRLYETAIASLDQADMLAEDEGWRRVVIEKPFGHDLPSARALNESIHQHLGEEQIYRIDHYLGKETVQNMLIFRFANSLYEPVWNRNYIDHVQITASETVDVGHRAGYYDGVGVMRDMMQNHMLQLLALVAIEPPASFDADALRNEKVKVLKAIRPLSDADVAQNSVRAQYEGYYTTEGVAQGSTTATFAALRLYIDNWRWQGVPFYLRSGKALPQKTTEISIVFKEPPHMMFPRQMETDIQPNRLSLCIQPDEGVHFTFQVKEPDTTADMRQVDMTFHYADSFETAAIPEAYERLLLDIIKGDASLFTRGDSIELAWGLIDPILEAWDNTNQPPLDLYRRGTWGPAAADVLLGQDCSEWYISCGAKHA